MFLGSVDTMLHNTSSLCCATEGFTAIFQMQLRKETRAAATTSSYADIDQNTEIHYATCQTVSAGLLVMVFRKKLCVFCMYSGFRIGLFTKLK